MSDAHNKLQYGNNYIQRKILELVLDLNHFSFSNPNQNSTWHIAAYLICRIPFCACGHGGKSEISKIRNFSWHRCSFTLCYFDWLVAKQCFPWHHKSHSDILLLTKWFYQGRRNGGALRRNCPPAFWKGWAKGEQVHLLNSIISNSMICQDLLETKLLQLFAHT